MEIEKKIIALSKQVIAEQATAINNLSSIIDQYFIEACQLLKLCQGHVIVMGMGKSGHIARKISATLASTGTPSFYVHPGEASHGDIGMITKNDVVLVLSNSGETEEIVTLIPIIKMFDLPLISITSIANSTIAKQSTVTLNTQVLKESCPLNLAPTTSSTVMLVIGDLLAICLLELKGFTTEDFSRSHPKGKLGRNLLVKIADIIHEQQQLPIVNEKASVMDAIIEIDHKSLGMCLIVNDDKQLVGVFTDGDIRRNLLQNKEHYLTANITKHMTKTFKTINISALAVTGLQIMEKNAITVLPVIDDDNQLAGIVHLHNIIQSGVITP